MKKRCDTLSPRDLCLAKKLFGYAQINPPIYEEECAEEVQSLSMRSLWTMMNGDSVPAQEFALQWMKDNVEDSEVSMRKWVDLASHDLLSVREHAFSVIKTDTVRQGKYPEE